MTSTECAAANSHALLDAFGTAASRAEYRRGEDIFRQGEPAAEVLYLESGRLKLSVVSASGQQAILSMLRPGDFFGEGCLGGQTARTFSATATCASAVRAVDLECMAGLLRADPAVAEGFIAQMLARNTRLEEDLLAQLFHSAEQRLVRTLLWFARCEHADDLRPAAPVSQETLAEMIGTTRSRVNVFMKKFERLGFIDYTDGLRIHTALADVVLRD